MTIIFWIVGCTVAVNAACALWWWLRTRHEVPPTSETWAKVALEDAAAATKADAEERK